LLPHGIAILIVPADRWRGRRVAELRTGRLGPQLRTFRLKVARKLTDVVQGHETDEKALRVFGRRTKQRGQRAQPAWVLIEQHLGYGGDVQAVISKGMPSRLAAQSTASFAPIVEISSHIFRNSQRYAVISRCNFRRLALNRLPD